MREFSIGNRILYALHSLKPGAQYELRDDDYDQLTWNDKEQTKPTLAELEAELIRLEEEWTAQEYARKRKAEYDALNQFEMQFDDKENGTTTWEDAIVAIKAKYPKG